MVLNSLDSPGNTTGCVLRCAAALASEWQLSFGCPIDGAPLSNQKQRWWNWNGHACLTNSLSPPSPFYSLHWQMNLTQQQVKKECIFVSHPTEAEHLKVPCVIFIDGCREAGVSLGLQQKEGSISPRLCNTVPWLWGNWRVCSVLACNPICVRLCPSTTLLPIKQSYCLILCGCPPKIQQQIWYCFISAVSSLSSRLFVLNFYVFFYYYFTVLKLDFSPGLWSTWRQECHYKNSGFSSLQLTGF